MLLSSAFGNVPWDSNFDSINEVMEEINFHHSEDNDCNWIFRGILPSPEIGDSRCTIYFCHEGLHSLINCELLVEFDEDCFQKYFDFYLDILSSKYGPAKFVDTNNHEIVWYHADDLEFLNLSGKLILKKETDEGIKISYYHPDYKNMLDKALSIRKNIIRAFI